MTIASEITRINNNIASAYTAASDKGATLPATQNSANLATCIDSITGGGGSTEILAYKLPNDATLDTTNATFTNGILGIYNDNTNKALGGVQYPLNLSVNSGDVIELKLNMAFMDSATGRDRTIFWLSNQTAGQTLWLDLYSGYRIVTWNGSTNGVYTYGSAPTVGQNFYLKLTITMTSATSGNIVLSKSTDDATYTNIGSSNNITLTEFNFDSLNLGAVQDFGSGQPSYLVKANYFLENCSITLNGTEIRDFVEPLPVLTTKTITTNGTYNASSDNADGYSQVTVNTTTTSYTYNVDFYDPNSDIIVVDGAKAAIKENGSKAYIKTKIIKLSDLNAANSWEICLDHRLLYTYSGTSYYRNVFATIDSTYSGADFQGINYIYENNRLNLFLGTGAPWDISTPVYSTDSVYKNGCELLTKISYNSSTGYTWQIKNLTYGDSNFTTIATVSNTNKIGQSNQSLDYYICLGNNGYNYNNSTTNGNNMEFNLENSYITIDGVTTYLAVPNFS